MSISKSHQIYYINTLFRTSGTDQDFTYQLQIPPHENYNKVVLLQACIPSTSYLIQENFNRFTLRENAANIPITVPPGNYTARSFASTISQLMTTASINAVSYQVSLPNTVSGASTGKYVYTATRASALPPISIVCTDNVNEQLGFATNSTNAFNAGTLTSTNTLNFAVEGIIFIHSDIADSGSSDVLQEIYGGNSQQNSFITYQCTTPELYSKDLTTNTHNTFRFSITNERKQLLNLHGISVLLTLCLYKSDDTNDMIKKYIQYKVSSASQN